MKEIEVIGYAWERWYGIDDDTPVPTHDQIFNRVFGRVQ